MSDRAGEFFVGYLPTPAGLRGFIRGAVAVLLLAGAALAVVLATQQRLPGRGSWALDTEIELTGQIVSDPAPMIRAADENGTVRSALIVLEGKHGAAALAQEFAGEIVTVRGTTIERDGVRMIEIVGEPTRPALSRSPLIAAPTLSAVSRVTLRGEIIDPKCFLGAMKPGEGKTHKACATLCIRGGIPPMFASLDERGNTVARLVEKPDIESIVPFIGDLVDVEADVWELGDIKMIRLLRVERVSPR
jgi:hypothetical protein